MNRISKNPLGRFIGLWFFALLILPLGYANAEEQEITEAELAQLLAPVALYPDSLLTHVLIASTYPLEVIEAHRWREQQDEDDINLSNIAEKKKWEPSVVALLSFPTVLQRMHDELTWTQELGEAFLVDEERVLSSIQTLRRQADNAGSFDAMDNVNIVREEKVIIIEPEQPEVIYVPYYDTRIVYGNWRWHHYPPVHWHRPWHYSYHYGPFSWHSGIHLSTHFWFTAFRWHKHHVVVSRPHIHHYRPRHKIVTSHHAKRWRHQPVHRRGATYRNPNVAKKYVNTYGKHKVVHAKQNHTVNSNKKYTNVHKSIKQKYAKQTRVTNSKVHNRDSNVKNVHRGHVKKYEESALLKPKKYQTKQQYSHAKNSTKQYEEGVSKNDKYRYQQKRVNKSPNKVYTKATTKQYQKKEPYQNKTWRENKASVKQYQVKKQPKQERYVVNRKSNTSERYDSNQSNRRATSSHHRSHKVHTKSRSTSQKKHHR